MEELLRAHTQLFDLLILLVVNSFLKTLDLLYFLCLGFESAAEGTAGLLPILEHVLMGLAHFLLQAGLQVRSAAFQILLELAFFPQRLCVYGISLVESSLNF